MHGPDAGAAGLEAVSSKLKGFRIALFRRLRDVLDFARGVLEKEAAHLGHDVRVAWLNLE